jgi:hypothetical protein
MDAAVDWPNAWEGGRVVGHAAVRDYWSRQFAAISSTVEPELFTEEPDGAVTVDVHQVVHDARTGELLSDARVRHRYRFAGDLVTRMDVLEPDVESPPRDEVLGEVPSKEEVIAEQPSVDEILGGEG